MFFSSFCESLKELILVPVESKEQDMHMNSRFDEMRNPATIKGKFILDSLIVVNLKEDDGVAQAHRRYQEYLVFQTNMKELTNHWNDASPCPVTTKKYISLTFKHLRKPRGMFEIWWAQQNAPFAWNMMEDELAVDGWYLNDPLETLDLTHVRSLRESVPVFIGKRLKASQAKLVSCFYSNQVTEYDSQVKAIQTNFVRRFSGVFRFLSKSSACGVIKIESTTNTR